nr:unnamed protein product [Digitaria exilis]
MAGRHVVGAHRQVDSDAYRAARAHGEVRHRELSEVPEPCSLVSRLTGLAPWSPITDNANTGVLALGDGRVICTSEVVSSWILVDPDTLDTVGKFRSGTRTSSVDWSTRRTRS